MVSFFRSENKLIAVEKDKKAKFNEENNEEINFCFVLFYYSIPVNTKPINLFI